MSKKLLRSRNLLKEELEEAQERLLSYVRRVGRYVQVEKQLKTCEEILSRAVEKNLQLIESAEQESEKELYRQWISKTTDENDAFCAQAREYLKQSKPTSDTLSSIVRKTKNSTASSEKLRLEASLRLQELERRAEENIRLAKAKADLELMQLEEENRRQVADAKILEELLEFDETISKKKSSSTSYKSSTQRTENWVTEVAETCFQQRRVDTEINPIVTEVVHVNANSVPEDVQRVRSVLVSQPVSASTQSQGTLPDLERIQLHKEAHFASQAKSFHVQKPISLFDEALSDLSLTKYNFRKIKENEPFENNQKSTPSHQHTSVRDGNGQDSPQTNVSVRPVIHESLWPQTNIPEKAEIFNQQSTKRPPATRITVDDFAASSHIHEVLPSNEQPKHLNVCTAPCYSNFQPISQHNVDQPSKTTCFSNLFQAQQPILYNTSHQQSAASHPSVSYRQESVQPIATTYQPLRSYQAALDIPTFNSKLSVPYRQEADCLFRTAHQTPVAHRQVSEEHRPNTHANSHNSCGNPTTVYQRPAVSYRQGTDNPQTIPSTFNLAELLAFNKRDPLPEWKLSCFDGNPLDWFEWFGQFKSAIDSSHLSNDVKLTYLKTLVSGKAKAAIQQFAYCGTMYEEALRTLQRKFGQPQAVVSAYLEKFSKYPPVKIHSSESIIDFATTMGSLVGVFKSLGYEADLNSTSLLNRTVAQLPPNIKEAWSFFTVKQSLERPLLQEFNTWLQQKAQAHDRMQTVQSQPSSSPIYSKQPSQLTQQPKIKFTKSFSSSTKEKHENIDYQQHLCPMCSGAHLLYRCSNIRNQTPNERIRFAVEKNLCFSCLQGTHSFRQCPTKYSCPKHGCKSSNSVLLHGAERVFSKSTSGPQLQNTEETSSKNSTVAAAKTCKGLLQIAEVTISYKGRNRRVLAMLDSGSTHTWIAENIAEELGLPGEEQTIRLFGINNEEDLPTRRVVFNVTAAHPSDMQPSSHEVYAYTKTNLSIGKDSYNVTTLKKTYQQLKPLPNVVVNYQDVVLLLGQDAYECIQPLEYRAGQPNQSIAVRTALGLVLSGPVTNQALKECSTFKAVTTEDQHLANQVQHWWELESYGSSKIGDSQSLEDQYVLKILEATTYHNGSRYVVGKLWSSEASSLPNSYYYALAQLRSLEKRFDRDPALKERYASTIKEDIEKEYAVEVPSAEIFETTSPRQWYFPHHPVQHPLKPDKDRRVLNGAAKFRDVSLNTALLRDLFFCKICYKFC